MKNLILLLMGCTSLFLGAYNLGYKRALSEFRPRIEANSVKLKELEERQAKVREICANRKIQPSMPTFCVENGNLIPCPDLLEALP